MFTHPDINPVALSIELPFITLAIRWYALAYLGGLLAGWGILRRIAPKLPNPITKEQVDDLAFWVVMGVVLGGRLGYVLVYKPSYYLQFPLEALKIWQGGMAFHGGLAGVIVACLLFARKYQLKLLQITDLLAIVTPIGLGLGRVANFINGELVGRPTDFAYGVIFPHIDALPRHASQLYEAALEGLLLGIIMVWAARKSWLEHMGRCSGLFMAGYGMARMVAECFREPDIQIGYIAGYITTGQLLSLPMLLLGIYLIQRRI